MDKQVGEDQAEVSVNLPCAQVGEVQAIQALLHLVQVGLLPQAGEDLVGKRTKLKVKKIKINGKKIRTHALPTI